MAGVKTLVIVCFMAKIYFICILLKSITRIVKDYETLKGKFSY